MGRDFRRAILVSGEEKLGSKSVEVVVAVLVVAKKGAVMPGPAISELRKRAENGPARRQAKIEEVREKREAKISYIILLILFIFGMWFASSSYVQPEWGHFIKMEDLIKASR